jgi:hypothetical protein
MFFPMGTRWGHQVVSVRTNAFVLLAAYLHGVDTDYSKHMPCSTLLTNTLLQ